MISSTMPSAKYSCSGSPDMFWNGKHRDRRLVGQRQRPAPPALPLAGEGARRSPSPASGGGSGWGLAVRRGRRAPAGRCFSAPARRDPRPAKSSLPRVWVTHRVRDADAAGLGQRFEPGGDVDPVAEDVVVVDDDVAEIDADAPLDAPVSGVAALRSAIAACTVDRAAHRIDDAGEFDEQPVAGGLDDAAVMLGDRRVDQLARAAPSAAPACPPRRAPISRE